MSRNNYGKGKGGGGMPNPTYAVPKDTRAAISKSNGVQQCNNLSLVLNRYVPQQAIYNESFGERKDKKYQSEWQKQVVRTFTKGKLQDIQQAVYERWQLTTDGATRFEMALGGRMVMGLGGGSVMETGITLSRNTGLPTIPGSALKGLARAYAVYGLAAEMGLEPLTMEERLHNENLRQQKDKKEKPIERLNLLDNLLGASTPEDAEPYMRALNVGVPFEEFQKMENVPLFQQAFGTHGKKSAAGACVFYEAVVADMPDQPFELDVMTPHFPKYYSGERPPSDDQQPNPVQFITVAAGTRFAFAIGLRRDLNADKREQAAAALNFAEFCLQAGLEQLGIGGKTAAGYGFFEAVP